MNNLSIPLAFIFDMDGTIVRNHEYHLNAWKLFCQYHHLTTTDEELLSLFGGKNDDIFRKLFDHKLSQEEVNQLEEEKESLYRSLYRPHIKEVEGLGDLLKQLFIAQIPTALATSAPTLNVNMILEALNIHEYFSCLIDANMVTHGKPHPEIFLKAAECLREEPQNCIVFEDSRVGIEAAKNAGCKVVVVKSPFTNEEFPEADFVIDDFRDPRIQNLIKLVLSKKREMQGPKIE
ncbi:MAG: Beta-phosphoglucomutase [Bacteroidetes bacterium 38_7]|nr:MAG: Beta-phosphoglucomutase [Bacteroidetes bacterium 38_7]HAL64531.1 hypothetical protein [Bacteroidales bacterium]